MINIRNIGVQYAIAGILALFLLPASAEEVNGKDLFLKNCSACHQADGQGIPDAFPALVGNAFVQGDVNELASLLLTGRGGMPNFSKRLNDQELAATLRYIRSAWGNRGAEISVERIAVLRAELHAEMIDATPQNNRH